MRIGLKEMIGFSKLLFPTVSDATFFESCGVADLITTCCNFSPTFEFTAWIMLHSLFRDSYYMHVTCNVLLNLVLVTKRITSVIEMYPWYLNISQLGGATGKLLRHMHEMVERG